MKNLIIAVAVMALFAGCQTKTSSEEVTSVDSTLVDTSSVDITLHAPKDTVALDSVK